MKKEFNTTGVCYPHEHYMMNNNRQLKEVFALIERGKYFTLNRPRQFGKTTSLHFLINMLSQKEAYLGIRLTFEDVQGKSHESEGNFTEMFWKKLERAFRRKDKHPFNTLKSLPKATNYHELAETITNLAHETDKKLVMLIDEVDASTNHIAFLQFLAMLRSKYLNRYEPQDKTFHSIVLAGVHDIKSLKYKLRHRDDVEYNSPWNIATDFKVDMSFKPKEIAPMLEEYSAAEGVAMDIPAIAERLHYHTSGYPFLVSRLCKIVAEEILPKRENYSDSYQKSWSLKDIEQAVQILLNEDNTNFGSLIKNLENHQDLYDLTFRIVIKGSEIAFNVDNPTIRKGILYGAFKRNGKIKIHNRVYEQRIYNYLASKVETSIQTDSYSASAEFQLPNGGLNFEKVLQKFQQFIKEVYSDKQADFLEHQWRVIFMAFIRPIVNGEGYTFKEVETSQEKRLDIVVTYNTFRYIIELKKWYGNTYHQRGLTQLADYLDIHNLEKGYLVIFDRKRQEINKAETIKHLGKTISAVWI